MKLKEYFYKNRISQREIGEKLACSASSVSRKLAGKQEFTASEISALAKMLGKTKDQIFKLLN